MEKNEEIKNEKTNKKGKKKILKRVLIILAILMFIGIATVLFLLYGPYSGFREWLITTAMTTRSHQYLATWFYDDETINEVLSKNRVQEVDEITDSSLTVILDDEDKKTEYANEYERAVLEKDPGNEDYKIIEIEGKGYTG